MSLQKVICYPAFFNAVTIDPGNLELNSNLITSYVQNAATSANLSISLCFDYLNSLPDAVSFFGVCPNMLMKGLDKLLQAVPVTDAVPVGLLLADKLSGSASGQYGLMFDGYGNDGSFKPRQGCAVFLTTIKNAMPMPGDIAFHEFVASIALHELGHAFNLWHTGNDSVMRLHPDPGDLGTTGDFNPLQKQYLARVADPAVGVDVIPGGSPFGTRPSDCGCPPDDDQSPYAGPRQSHKDLKLKISLSHKSFWAFEPIEMDLQLSIINKRKKSVSIPHEIDPGYNSFQIWLTNPIGEKRRYRSDVRFCQSNGEFELERGKPFRRDISVFRELGRDTFGVPGKYTIRAALHLRTGKFVWSNGITCTVKPPEHGQQKWESARKILGAPATHQLFRFKNIPPAKKMAKELASFAERASPTTSFLIHYALGKAYARTTMCTPKIALKSKLRSRAVLHLNKALKMKPQNIHRRASANTLLMEMYRLQNNRQG